MAVREEDYQGARGVIVVQEHIALAVPARVAWEVLSDLETLIRADPLHRRVMFLGERRRGPGTKALVWHGLPVGPTFPRLLSVVNWEEGVCVRWTDVDVSHKMRKYIFPHSEEFVITPVGEQCCVLTDTVRGSIKLSLPIARRYAEWVARALVVRQVVRLEDRALRRLVRAKHVAVVAAGDGYTA